MDRFSIMLVILVTTLFVEIAGVNSPQMTFFTPPSHDGIIHLESKYGYSAKLKLSRESSSPSLAHDDRGGVPDMKDAKGVRKFEYRILGPNYPYHGVSAVIQEMNLRKSESGESCRDFVQFSVNASRESQTNQICGKISRDEPWNDKNVTDSRAQRSFFSPGGKIYLYFFSDILDENTESSEPETSGGAPKTNDENVGIEIVFTSYTVCPNPANSWKKLKTCSSTEQMSCIYSTLFCDSKVDCGFPGEYGIDEQGCYIPYIYMALSIFAAIFVTTSLMYLFVKWVTKVPKDYE